jgi:predicted DNA-binding transcriptional regulator AlpA
MLRYALHIALDCKDYEMKQRLLTSKDVRTIYGDVSQTTLWRWLKDTSLGFPQPIHIKRRRYFDADEIDRFRTEATGTKLSGR